MTTRYTNLTVRSANPHRVASSLAKVGGGPSQAMVLPPDNDCVVVLDETADPQKLEALAKALSHATHAAVLAVLQDDEVLRYWLYEVGELSDRYDSGGGARGSGEALCRAFGVYDDASVQVDEILGAPSHPDRHRAMIDALGLSQHAVGTRHGGPLPEGVEPDDCLVVRR